MARAVTVAVGEEVSGDYYDWRKTRQPERPYLHPYHQVLVMKIFLAEKQPNEGCKVYLTFEQALEVIRKLDHLTCAIPKIVYLVGWQYNGHDSKYPSWAEVNPRLKRPQDQTAAESLRWLMTEGFKYHTTVSLHINMFDAYQDSPLWQTYLEHDIIAKDENGNLLKGEVGDVAGATPRPDTQIYYISYAREWETGFARKRIDGLLAMLPIQRAGTIHIDAFHSLRPIPHAYPQEKYPGLSKQDTRISPYLGYSLEKEVAAQRKIFRYFRDQGVDVTSEGSTFLRPDAFVGLQPMAWHYDAPAPDIPPSLYCGTPMPGEAEIRRDPKNLSGLLEQFCLRVVPWYYANHTTASKGQQKMRDGDDLCMPALWKEKLLVAYTRQGCADKSWQLPPGWSGVRRVVINTIGLEPPGRIEEREVVDNCLRLSLKPGQGVSIVPAGEVRPFAAETNRVLVTDFGAKPDDGEDDTAGIQAATEKARQIPGSVLVFPKGQYDLKSKPALAEWERMITAAKPGHERWRGAPPAGLEGWPTDKHSVLQLTGVHDLVVDGGGSTLMVHGLCQPISVQNCQHVILKDLRIDWRQPPFMTGKVLECVGRHLDVEIIDDAPVAGGEPFIAVQVYDPKSKLPTGLETFAGVESTELLRPHVLRLNLTHDARGDALAGRVPVGHLLVLRHILGGYEPIEVRNSTQVRLEDVDLYTGPGMGILGVGTRDLTLLRVRIIPKPGTSRLMSTTADGTHFINCSGTIELRDCTLAGEGDDHLNIHGQYQFVEKRIDDRNLEARIGTRAGFGQWSECWVQGWAVESKPGDHVEFFRANNLSPFGEAQIESVDFNRQTGHSRITFKQRLPAQLQAEDLFQDCDLIPRLRVSGCTFGPNRARGALVTTRDAVIENNTFDRVGGTAIFVCCEMDWLEAPAPSDIVVRNNQFQDCGYAVANEGGALTLLFKQGQRIEGWIRDVRIEGNTFTGTHGAAISASQVESGVIRSNIFQRYQPAVVLRTSRDIQITHNTLKDGSRRIVVESSCETPTVQVKDNTEVTVRP